MKLTTILCLATAAVADIINNEALHPAPSSFAPPHRPTNTYHSTSPPKS
jgi:hypothetical protein